MHVLPTSQLPHPAAARKAKQGPSGKPLTQKQLAAQARIGWQTVIRSERDGAFPVTIDVRERYLSALDIKEER